MNLKQYNIFKVLYSPIKGFKEITENPTTTGVIIIMVLSSLLLAGLRMSIGTKMLVENTFPADEAWTESIDGWSSNGNLTVEQTDSIMGNYSIRCFVQNSSVIQMKKTIEPLNCSEKGLKKLYFSVKLNHTNNVPPAEATLRLLSPDENKSFETSFINLLNFTTWSNLSLSVSTQSWEKLNCLEFQIEWPQNQTADLTLLVDGLLFGGTFSPEISATAGNYVNLFLYSVFMFIISWAVYFLAFVLIFKVIASGQKREKTLFAALGYSFAPLIVCYLVCLVLTFTLPTIEITVISRLETAGFQQWRSLYPVIYALLYFVPLLWSMNLCGVAVHFIYDFSWGKALFYSYGAYLLGFFLQGIVLLLMGF